MKKVISLLTAFLLAFSLTACGGKASTENTEVDKASTETPTVAVETETIQSDEPVTIKVANYAILESGYTEFWENIKKGYEDKYPNVTVEWVTAPYNEILSQVINMAGAGDKVDLVFSEIMWIPALVDSGLAEPMENVVDPEFLEDYYTNILDAHSIDETVYAAPLYVSPFILFYNTELFLEAGLDPNKPPTTYDEMLEYAKALSQLKTVDGNKVYAFGQATASVPVAGASLNSMVANFGGEVITGDLSLDIANKGFTQAMDMLKLLDDEGYNPQNTKPKDLRNLFALEQLAMYYDSSWGFNGVSSINPDASSFTATAMPLAGGEGIGSSYLQSHCFVAVNNGDAQLEATKNFIQYVISKDILSDYMYDITPAFAAKLEMADVINPLLIGAKDANAAVVTTPMFSTVSDFYLEISALAQGVTVGDKDVESAMKEFETGAKSIIPE